MPKVKRHVRDQKESTSLHLHQLASSYSAPQPENEVRNDEESEADKQVPRTKVVKRSNIERTVKHQKIATTNLMSENVE